MIRMYMNINKVTKDLELGLLKVQEELAEKISVIVDEEFLNLLNNTPQSYGNYVANWGIRLGGGGRLKAPILPYPRTQTNRDKMARGSIGPISIAVQNSSDFAPKLKARVQQKSFTDISFTIYNSIGYAEKVEGYSAAELRSVNAEGAHAKAKAEAALKERFSQRMVI